MRMYLVILVLWAIFNLATWDYLPSPARVASGGAWGMYFFVCLAAFFVENYTPPPVPVDFDPKKEERLVKRFFTIAGVVVVILFIILCIIW